MGVMTGEEAEIEIKKLIVKHCYESHVSLLEINDFLFEYGGLYKIEAVLEQVEKEEDYG